MIPSLISWPAEPDSLDIRFRCAWCSFWHWELTPLIQHYENVEERRMKASERLRQRRDQFLKGGPYVGFQR